MNKILVIIIPFIGTVLGSSMVFLMKNNIKDNIQKLLLGFASGVMIAASIWSLLIPSINMSSNMGKFAFIPASLGFLLGVLFLFILDKITPHIHLNNEKEGINKNLKRTTMLILAVTLHNIPEGIAVGVTFAGFLSGNNAVTFLGAVSLSVGIAIQNFPEGAIISMPLKNEGIGKKKSFLYGALSGIVEPIASFLTIMISSFFIPILPYLLSFAAGAMIYVVVEELIPEASKGVHSNMPTIGFSIGFVVMMILDVVLG